ncbi:MAG: hypothetical protein ABW185_09305 [Sedimenticola sp.]
MSQILPLKSGVASRGHVYRCLHCTSLKPYEGEKRRVVSHIYKDHVPLTRAPFYCKICLFRCLDEESLIRHVTVYPLHTQKQKELLARGYNGSDETALLRATHPYLVHEGRDMVKLNNDDSESIWSNRGKSVVEGTPVMQNSQVGNEDVWGIIMDGFSGSESLSPVPAIRNLPLQLRTPPAPSVAVSRYSPYVPQATSLSVPPAPSVAVSRYSPYVPQATSLSVVPPYVPTVVSSGLDTPGSAPMESYLDILCQPEDAVTAPVQFTLRPKADTPAVPAVSVECPASVTNTAPTQTDGSLVLAIHQMTDRLVAAIESQTASYDRLRVAMTGFVRRTEEIVTSQRQFPSSTTHVRNPAKRVRTEPPPKALKSVIVRKDLKKKE